MKMLRANKRVRYLGVWAVLLLFVINGGSPVSAQKSQKLSATPRAFQIFYAKFRKAVIARDKTTVASLTRFPLTYGFDAGDEGTFSRAEFLKRYNDIFGGERKVFSLRNPTLYSDGQGFDLVDQNDASHYVFEKRGASYQFTGYLSEP